MAAARIPTDRVPDSADTTAVRSATGADQEWYASVVATTAPVELAAVLVERCTDGGITASAALDLPVGRRVALLWGIRRATFGDTLDAVVECAACHEKMDVSLSVGDLLAREPVGPTDGLSVEIDGRSVTYRVPTGHDQRSALADADPARALCRACLIEVDGTPTGQLPDDVVDALIDPLGTAIGQIDPLADAELRSACPTCGADVVATLDAHDYLRDELLSDAGRLLDEIHLIASRYHWSERDILALPIQRRRAYLEMIADDGERGW